MKGIVITTGNEMYIANFRDFGEIAKTMGWRITEHVKPWGLGPKYCMLIDDEGRLNERPVNNFGSLMYGFLVHGTPIVGDIVIMRDGRDLVTFERDIVGLDDEDLKMIWDMIIHVWKVTPREEKK